MGSLPIWRRLQICQSLTTAREGPPRGPPPAPHCVTRGPCTHEAGGRPVHNFPISDILSSLPGGCCSRGKLPRVPGRPPHPPPPPRRPAVFPKCIVGSFSEGSCRLPLQAFYSYFSLFPCRAGWTYSQGRWASHPLTNLRAVRLVFPRNTCDCCVLKIYPPSN